MNSSISNNNEVTILGAGIVGLCCALSLLEKGFPVTVIDRELPGQATSFGNAGVISPWSSVPQNTPGVWKSVPKWMLDPKGPVRVRWGDLDHVIPWALDFIRNSTVEKVTCVSKVMHILMADNIATYRGYLAGTGHEDLLRDSWFVNAFRGTTKANLNDITWRLKREHGADIEQIGGAALRDIEPALSPEFHSAILIKRQARTIAPGELGTALAELAAKRGARFIRSEVNGLDVSNGKITLVTESGRHAVQKLVLSAGVWSRRLLAPLGLRLPLIAERGYHIEFDEPGLTLTNSVQDMLGRVILNSMTTGLRVAGTTELGRPDMPPNYQRADALVPLARRILPSLSATPSRKWMGNRPSFPDNLPAIGALPGHPNLIAAFGHSHYGMSMAPGTGRIVAQIVAGSPRNEILDAVAPDRFSM